MKNPQAFFDVDLASFTWNKTYIFGKLEIISATFRNCLSVNASTRKKSIVADGSGNSKKTFGQWSNTYNCSMNVNES